ncbi:MAG: SagB family peptide dehydrogenase [Candidatus Acidiferrales bacterium]
MRRAKQPAFRRAPFLVSYWEEGRLVFENYATGARASAAPITSEVLDFFDRWRPAKQLFRRLNRYAPASLQRAIDHLVRLSFLQRSDKEENSIERLLPAWKDWNPSAGFLHFSTRDMPYETDLLTLDRHVRRFAREKKIPDAAKHYPRAAHTPLPEPRMESEFGRVLLERRTWRRFSREPMNLPDLGTLLGLTWGVREWTQVPGIGRFAMKTSPSGGALHPIEAYVVARNVEGIPRGLYHYDSDRHCLELLRKGATSRQIQDYLAGQEWFSEAAALVLMTARFRRTQWKYRNARAYRVVMLEAGHLCQTFCLTATWLKLAPFCTMALAESRIEKDLGIDGVTEGVIYAAGVGKIPPGSDWKTASLPEIRAKRK